MKLKCFIVVLIFLLIFPFISSVLIQENSQFKPSSTNTTFIFANNLTFDLVEVHSTYLKLDNNTIFTNPSVGSVNITIFNFTNSYKKWNETKSDSSATISYIISNFSSGVSVLITKNSVAWQAVIANSTSYVSFDYSGNSALFELELGAMPITTEEETPTSGSPPVYYPTQKQLEEGYSKLLRKTQKVQFIINEETYTAVINSVNVINKKVEIEIEGEGILVELSEGSVGKIDLNDDGYYDLQISCKEVRINGYADLEFKEIHEEIPAEEKEEQESPSKVEEIKIKNWMWISGGTILLIVVGIVIRRLLKKSNKL